MATPAHARRLLCLTLAALAALLLVGFAPRASAQGPRVDAAPSASCDPATAPCPLDAVPPTATPGFGPAIPSVHLYRLL